MTTEYVKTLLTTTTWLSLLSITTHAQEATEPLQALTVNARLWSETLIEIPDSTVAIQADAINDIDPIEQLLTKTSNITLEQSSVQTRTTIRGITGIDGGLQDPVGHFVNGVALPLGGNQLPALFDLHEISILKGPQGSLYGRNTEAGAIVLTTTDPSWTPSRWSTISASSLEGAQSHTPTYTIASGISGALINDTLAGNIAFRFNDEKGPYINQLDNSTQGGDVNQWSLSTGLTWVVNETTDITLKTIIDDNDQGRNRFRFSSGVNKTPRFNTNADTNGFDNDHIAIHSLQINHSFQQMELTAITGVTRYERDFLIDLDATPAALPATALTLDNNALSQEIRLTSTAHDNWRWLAGMYVYKEESDINFQISPQFMSTTRNTAIDQTGSALFGQVEYAITPRTSILFGSRVERIRQYATQDFSNNIATERYTARINKTEVLPMVNVSYRPSHNSTGYISYKKGYLPGGYNYNTAGNEETLTYKPEYSTQLELGWKQFAFNNRVQTQLALFRTSTRDKQIADLVPGGLQKITNAGKTTVYGVELSTDIAINRYLSSYFTLGFQRSKANSLTTTLFQNGGFVNADLSGNRLPLAAKRTYAAGIHYKKPQGLLGRLAVRGSSDYYFDSQNTLKQPSYVIIDAEIGYQLGTGELLLWAKNLTDKAILSRAVNTPNGVVVEDTAARTIGIQFKTRW